MRILAAKEEVDYERVLHACTPSPLGGPADQIIVVPAQSHVKLGARPWRGGYQ